MPLAAVVCTRAVAESFENGLEYFNTFGGNPVHTNRLTTAHQHIALVPQQTALAAHQQITLVAQHTSKSHWYHSTSANHTATTAHQQTALHAVTSARVCLSKRSFDVL
jgi:acetylornithine/succinyldiaminopimelate/putrescine aminotransferase